MRRSISLRLVLICDASGNDFVDSRRASTNSDASIAGIVGVIGFQFSSTLIVPINSSGVVVTSGVVEVDFLAIKWIVKNKYKYIIFNYELEAKEFLYYQFLL